ncbi:hypothetical protein Xbud_00273 [Xenorhabdus budapestensis]|uniref:Uncharacterized protein n=2 Tax=Xenorhabdus budapestensis TaxID=290110 RepID=A0A2D0J5F3_XENBU|nr:hypothetical protein Xbud_00273 [Xenorhabdus budapestensis]
MRHYRSVMVLSTQLTIPKFKLVSLGDDTKKQKTADIHTTAVFVFDAFLKLYTGLAAINAATLSASALSPNALYAFSI